jgi:hypothetical protein
MTQTWSWGMGLIAAAAFLASAAQTADARSNRQSAMQEDQQSRRSSDWQKISGTVKRAKTVGLQGRDQENLVVQLETDRGRKKIVDLGNVEHLEDLDIQKGDRITAWGRTIDIGDKQVFMAHKLKANDETVHIERQLMSEEDMSGRRSRQFHSQRSRGQPEEFERQAQRRSEEDY